MQIAPNEAVRVAREWLEAGHARDGARMAAVSHCGHPDAIFAFGSGQQSTLSYEALLGHLTEVIPCHVEADGMSGFAVGGIAWVTGTPRTTVPGEGVLELRFTCVLQLIDGEWKVVHGHLSEEVPHLVGD